MPGLADRIGLLRPGTEIGEFGPITRSIVEAFQRDHGLTVDGLVGPKTRADLGL